MDFAIIKNNKLMNYKVIYDKIKSTDFENVLQNVNFYIVKKEVKI